MFISEKCKGEDTLPLMFYAACAIEYRIEMKAFMHHLTLKNYSTRVELNGSTQFQGEDTRHVLCSLCYLILNRNVI